MAGFYYRDHLFVNIIYTLRGGGSAAARATLSSTRGIDSAVGRGWLLDTVDDFSRILLPLSLSLLLSFPGIHFDLLTSDELR